MLNAEVLIGKNHACPDRAEVLPAVTVDPVPETGLAVAVPDPVRFADRLGHLAGLSLNGDR
jgi:hypothetical protein